MVECFKDIEKGKKEEVSKEEFSTLFIMYKILHVSPLTPYEVLMKVSNSMAQVR